MAVGDRPGGETLGSTIQRLRRERGLTQRQAADRLGVDFTYLSKIENGRGEPPGEETVRKLSELLETDVEELLALAGKVPPELRERAQRDLAFARFLRHLPSVPEKDLEQIYRQLKIDP